MSSANFKSKRTAAASRGFLCDSTAFLLKIGQYLVNWRSWWLATVHGPAITWSWWCSRSVCADAQVSQYTFAMCSYRERKHDPTDILQLDGHTVDFCDPLEGRPSNCLLWKFSWLKYYAATSIGCPAAALCIAHYPFVCLSVCDRQACS